MPLLDIQRRGRELGRIRLGQQVMRNGKSRPEKLSTFRFTTRSRPVADHVAGLLGGEVREWNDQWEVVTEASEVPVMVPPGEAFVSQFWELWTGGGCVRRCDGERVTLFTEQGEQQKLCVCPADLAERAAIAATGKACRPTTRLNVIVPDLPDLGVWRVETHGLYAAQELGGVAQVMQQARDAGIALPATLRLEQRQGVRRPGRPTNQFVVPVLELAVTLREMHELGEGGARGRMMLPPAPSTARAITAGAPATTPVTPASGPQAIADLVTDTRTKADVIALWREAEAASWLDDMVANPADELEPLRALLQARGEELS